LWLIQPIIAASVVDLPEPVGPVISTRPCGRVTRREVLSGRPICSGVGISSGITRNASAGWSRW
jgi:hypothetical protein